MKSGILREVGPFLKSGHINFNNEFFGPSRHHEYVYIILCLLLPYLLLLWSIMVMLIINKKLCVDMVCSIYVCPVESLCIEKRYGSSGIDRFIVYTTTPKSGRFPLDPRYALCHEHAAK